MLIRRGLDNAGKSSIVQRWLGEGIEKVSPTFGFSIRTLQLPQCTLNLWDIGGQRSIRAYWRNYYEQTDGLVWVIDSSSASSSPARLEDCRRELEAVLGEDRLAGASLLILANKQDCTGALSPAQIQEYMGLEGISSHWRIFPCSARDGTNCEESLRWLVDDICKRLIMT